MNISMNNYLKSGAVQICANLVDLEMLENTVYSSYLMHRYSRERAFKISVLVRENRSSGIPSNFLPVTLVNSLPVN